MDLSKILAIASVILVILLVLLSAGYFIYHKVIIGSVIRQEASYREYVFRSQTDVDQAVTNTSNALRECLQGNTHGEDDSYSLSNSCIEWMHDVSAFSRE